MDDRRAEIEAVLAECVTIAEIAVLADVTHSCVSNWTARFVDFPAPVLDRERARSRMRLWLLPEIVEWLDAYRDGRAGVTHKMERRGATR